jgi:hypothetical protein
LEAVFVLLEFLSPSRRFFIDSIHSPISGRQIGPSIGIRARVDSFESLTSLRSKDGVPGTGIRSSALRWEELPDVAETDGCVPPWKRQVLWDVTLNTAYVHPINFLAPRSREMFDAKNKVVDYLFRALC